MSCGITHTAVVPLDLVKCRIQVDPAKYKSVFNGFKVTLKEDGTRGLAKGWAPTFFGYSAQGLCKFGLYEVFKVGNLLRIFLIYLWFNFYCIHLTATKIALKILLDQHLC